jgi:hypothetical protein
VVVIKGLVHSQFNSNQNVTSFGLKDACAEIDWQTAHAMIGSAVSNFMTVVHGSGDIKKAKAALADGVAYAEQVVSGFLKAQEYEADQVCIDAQKMELVKIGASEKFTVEVDKANAATFLVKFPSQDGNKITVVQEITYALNLGDLSTMDMSAQSVNCKILSAVKLAGMEGMSVPVVADQGTCQDFNVASISKGMSLAFERTKNRYNAIQKHFNAEKDSVYSTGITWEASSLKFDDSGSSVEVQSPSLHSFGYMLCRYLSPARTLEYMMVDGLPAFDSCKSWDSDGSASIVV